MHNCWDALNCGMEKMCPAYPHQGRTCFAIPGTLCRGEKQGDYVEKIARCREMCSHYASIMSTEGAGRPNGPSKPAYESNQARRENGKPIVPLRETCGKVRPVVISRP
jgi:hypothetical protein